MATAMVTGGTAGIGAAFARALAARGENLILVARDSERLAATAAELSDRHAVSVETLTADLAVRDDVDRVIARLTDAAAPVDRLVNNAGFGLRSGLTAQDLGPQEHALDVMVRAVLLLAGAAGRAMKARGAGSIINVSSTAGYVTMGNYSAIKSWVTIYTEGLAVELAGTGVRVTALLPGWVRTEFHSRAKINISSIPAPMWLDADDLVAEGLRDNDRGKIISIPSKRYRAAMFVLRHAPRSFIRSLSSRMISRRH
jgi:uncharacterized protein